MLLGHPGGLVVVDRSRLKEVFEAPSSQLSFLEAIYKDMDFRHIFNADDSNHYHIHVIRHQLTQNIAAVMSDTVDELNAALEDDLEAVVSNGILTKPAPNHRLDKHCRIYKSIKDYRENKSSHVCWTSVVYVIFSCQTDKKVEIKNIFNL